MINLSVFCRVRLNFGRCGICCLELLGLRKNRVGSFFNDFLGFFIFELLFSVSLFNILMVRKKFLGKNVLRKRKGEEKVFVFLFKFIYYSFTRDRDNV